jgi:hypothetical protein
MQNYKKLANNLFSSQKNNFADFAQETKELSFIDTLQPKSYYQTNKDLYFGAKCFAFLAQVATMISSFSFFENLLQIKITSPYLLIATTVIVLLLIEIMKYLTLNKALQGLFSLPTKPNYALLVFGLLLSLGSIYASIQGGANLGIDTNKIATTKTEYDSEIATLRTEIASIQARNTYKGNTYITGKDKSLLHTKEKQLQAIQAKKDTELAQVNRQNEKQATTFKIGFGLFDLLFLLCTFYVWYFMRMVSIERLANNLPTEQANEQANISPPTKQDSIQDNTQEQGNNGAIPQSTQPQRIGFTYDFTHLKKQNANDDLPNELPITPNVITPSVITPNVGSGNKICLHCGIVYTYKIHNQKFCSVECRILAWELRTGKTLSKGKNK